MQHKHAANGGTQKGSVWLGNLTIKGAGAEKFVSELTAAAPPARAANKAGRAPRKRIGITKTFMRKIETKANFLIAAHDGITGAADPAQVARKTMGLTNAKDRKAFLNAKTQILYPGGRSA